MNTFIFSVGFYTCYINETKQRKGVCRHQTDQNHNPSPKIVDLWPDSYAADRPGCAWIVPSRPSQCLHGRTLHGQADSNWKPGDDGLDFDNWSTIKTDNYRRCEYRTNISFVRVHFLVWAFQRGARSMRVAIVWSSVSNVNVIAPVVATH